MIIILFLSWHIVCIYSFSIFYNWQNIGGFIKYEERTRYISYKCKQRIKHFEHSFGKIFSLKFNTVSFLSFSISDQNMLIPKLEPQSLNYQSGPCFCFSNRPLILLKVLLGFMSEISYINVLTLKLRMKHLGLVIRLS